MEKGEEFGFNNKYDLKGLVYNLDQLSRSYKEIALLSTRINNLGGRISFSISANTIIILEQIQENFIQTELMKYDKFDKAVILQNDVIKLVMNKKTKTLAGNSESGKSENERSMRKEYKEIVEKNLRIIKLNDLEKIMTHLEKNSTENHFLHGLPRNVDLNATISVIIKSNDPKKKSSAHFHTFETLTILNSNKKYYDFPRYFKCSPDGFAIFMTYREKKKIQKYMLSIPDKVTDILKEENIMAEDDLNNLPVPHKNNKICNICRSQFDNYLEHVQSDSHKNLIASNDSVYARINQSFSKIREFWKIIAKDSDQGNERSCEIKEESSLYEKQNNMNGLILCHSKLVQETQVIYSTVGENICKKDSDINITNAYNDLNSMYPDIISRSTKIYSAENEKNERLIQEESKYENEEDNSSSQKEFLSKKRKCRKINKTSKKSSESNTSLKSKKKNDYKDPHRKMTRSNYAETIKNDDSLKTLVNLVFSDEFYYIKSNKEGRKK